MKLQSEKLKGCRQLERLEDDALDHFEVLHTQGSFWPWPAKLQGGQWTSFPSDCLTCLLTLSAQKKLRKLRSLQISSGKQRILRQPSDLRQTLRTLKKKQEAPKTCSAVLNPRSTASPPPSGSLAVAHSY